MQVHIYESIVYVLTTRLILSMLSSFLYLYIHVINVCSISTTSLAALSTAPVFIYIHIPHLVTLHHLRLRLESESVTHDPVVSHSLLSQSINLSNCTCLATIIQSTPHKTRYSPTTRKAFDLSPAHGALLEEERI